MDEVFWRVVIDVNSEIDAHKVFNFVDKHVDEMGVKVAEYYVESGRTVAGFDKDEVRLIRED